MFIMNDNTSLEEVALKVYDAIFQGEEHVDSSICLRRSPSAISDSDFVTIVQNLYPKGISEKNSALVRSTYSTHF